MAPKRRNTRSCREEESPEGHGPILVIALGGSATDGGRGDQDMRTSLESAVRWVLWEIVRFNTSY